MTNPWNERRGRTVVLGAGFVGWSIAESLSRRRHVTVMSRSVPGGALRGVDVTVDALTNATLRGVLGADADVVYAIGSTVPGSALSPDEMLERELRPLQAAIDAAIDQQARRFLFCSSGGTVYGDPGLDPVGEDAPLAPVSAYGQTRVAAEQLVAQSFDGTGVDACSLRLANVYGPRQPMVGIQGVIGAGLRAVLTGDPMPLFGEGRQVRDFVHADDLAVAVEGLLDVDGPLPDAVNIGSGRGTSIAEVLEQISTILGRPVPVAALASRGIDVSHIVLAIDRLRRLVPDYEPRLLPAGLLTCVEALTVDDRDLDRALGPDRVDD